MYQRLNARSAAGFVRLMPSRKMLRKGAVKRMKEAVNVKAEMIYVDILNEMERIGNDALNIVHALNHKV